MPSLFENLNLLQPDVDNQTRQAFAPPAKKRNLFDTLDLVQSDEVLDLNSASSYTSAKNNKAVQEAAVRFLAERYGQDGLKPDEAFDEIVSHFRSFDVNEMTAAGDYGYVSAAASDATNDGDEKAKERLADYRLLYQTYSQLPGVFDEGGAPGAFGDYLKGLATAPSTYVGLVLPGVGKGAGLATTQAAKAGVNATLNTTLKTATGRVINAAASRPLLTTVGVEATAGSLQNIAAQKTEIEADLRDRFDARETAVTATLSGLLPASELIRGGKRLGSTYIERNTGDLLDEADKATVQKLNTATEKAKKTLKSNQKIQEEFKELLRPIDTEIVKRGKQGLDETRDSIQKGYMKGEGLDQPIFGADEIVTSEADFNLVVNPEKSFRLQAYVVSIAAKAGLKREAGERITEFINRARYEMDDETIKDIADEFAINADDLVTLQQADMITASVSEMGRGLRQQRTLRELSDALTADAFGVNAVGENAIKDILDDVTDGSARASLIDPKKTPDDSTNFLRSADQLRLAAMTSQTATTMRNNIGGIARVGIDTLTKAIDRGIAKAVGKGISTPNEDVFAVAYGILNKKEAVAVQSIFQQGFGTKASQLFRELVDLDNATELPQGPKMSRTRAIAANLNALNTISDNIFKRAAFVGQLKRQLNELYSKKLAKGEITQADASKYNLANIIRSGEFKNVFEGKVGQEMLDKAIDESLYFTYQRTPDNPMMKSLIQGVHKAPFLVSSLIPFPRFIANAMRFTYEYSPAYLVQGTYRSLIRDENNYEEMAKAIAGTGLLAMAAGFRMTEMAGEEWYEAKLPDGKTIDLRPFFPAAPYLWVGDFIARAMQGDPVAGQTRDTITSGIQALTGTQFRAGFGIYALDSAVNDFLTSDDPEKAAKIFGNFVSNLVSTYSIPLTVTQDVYNTFLAPDDERIVRDRNINDVWSLIVAKSISRLPGNNAIERLLSEKIGTTPSEVYELGTREEKLRRTIPLSRQITGALISEGRNTLEKEMARLKIPRRVLHRKTGVPEADILINKTMGEYATNYLVPTIENSNRYKQLNTQEQQDFIRNRIDDYKTDIMNLVKEQSRAFGKERFGFDPMKKVYYKRNFTDAVKKKAIDAYHNAYGNPQEIGQEYDFEKLITIAKYFKEISD